MSNWFDVDKAGLAKLVASKPRAFIVYELLQNAWDQKVTRVDVTLEPVAGTRNAQIIVADDDPDGFADLRDAYTLFAESRKKGNAEQRGRFNLGEKLVLALAKAAYIETTTGSVRFDEQGRHASRQRRDAGSLFRATIPMTKADLEEIDQAVKRLIPPADVATTFNGRILEPRFPVAFFNEVLPTVVADEEGVLRKTSRKTLVQVYEPAEGETAMLYEMGIPVVETGDRFHVDVQQKVPLNMDRDNVTPAYLADDPGGGPERPPRSTGCQDNSPATCGCGRLAATSGSARGCQNGPDSSLRRQCRPLRSFGPRGQQAVGGRGAAGCLWREPHVGRVVQCQPGRRAAGGRRRDAEPQALFPGWRPAGRGSREPSGRPGCSRSSTMQCLIGQELLGCPVHVAIAREAWTGRIGRPTARAGWCSICPGAAGRSSSTASRMT